ncbi:hypothetical protein ID866_3256 [Astraeus odoratus]|nr:hypothetical protein ID866_3256 [Astraeus odoratus]
MTVKSQVQEFVHDVKHIFHKHHHHHHRDESNGSSHTFVSDGSSRTAYSDEHSRPTTPEYTREHGVGSQPGTPEHGRVAPVTPERKRVSSMSSHKHGFFHKLRRKASNLSIDAQAASSEHESLPSGPQPGTPERSSTISAIALSSAALSSPATPESSLFGSIRHRVPSISRKPNVLHKLRRRSSHIKLHSEPHMQEKDENPGLHHQSSLSKLRETEDASQGAAPAPEPERDAPASTKEEDRDRSSTPSRPPTIEISPPVEVTDPIKDAENASEHDAEKVSGQVEQAEGASAIEDTSGHHVEDVNPQVEQPDCTETTEVASTRDGEAVGPSVEKEECIQDTEDTSSPAGEDVSTPVGKVDSVADTEQTHGGAEVGAAVEKADSVVEQASPNAGEEVSASVEKADSVVEQASPNAGEEVSASVEKADSVADTEQASPHAGEEVSSSVEKTDSVADASRCAGEEVSASVDKTDSVTDTEQASLHAGGEVDVSVEKTDTVADTEDAFRHDAEESGEDADCPEMEMASGASEHRGEDTDSYVEVQPNPEVESEPDVSGTLVSDAVDSDLNPDGNGRKSPELFAKNVAPVPPATEPIPVPPATTVEKEMSKVDDIPGPDPFAGDDDATTSDNQDQSKVDVSLSDGATPTQSAPAPTPGPIPVLPPVNVNKPTPAPPAPRPQSRAETSPVPPPSTPAPNSSGSIYLPRLTAPSMFLPIPNTDPMGALLTRYIPPERRPRRDVTGEWSGREMHEMVMSNSWRALAKMARDLIVASDPEDLCRILDLWSLRLSALARLRLANQASAECNNLFAVLNAVPPAPTNTQGGGASTLHSPASAAMSMSPAGTHAPLPLPTPTQRPSPLPAHLGVHAQALTHPPVRPGHPHPHPHPHAAHGVDMLSVYPFELAVLRARVHYWAGDARGYVDALAGLLVGCKAKARAEGKVMRVLKEERAAKKNKRDIESREVVETSEEGHVEIEDEAEDEGEKGGDDEGERGDENDIGETGDQSDNGAEEAGGQSQQGGEEQPRTKTPEEDELDDAVTTAEANLSMWLERAARVCLMIASQFVEMKDYPAALSLLIPLCSQRPSPSEPPAPSPAIHSAVARVYLLSGNVRKAEEHFRVVASCVDVEPGILAMNTALMCSATGDWPNAEVALREALKHDPRNYTAMNNLAVTLLAQGKVKDGIELLESAVRASPASVLVAEPFIFNLSTLYELRSATAMDKKRELLVEVARWSGDGLKTTCLKMPSN